MSRFVIGLTGGIASGKSAVEGFFRQHGVFVADADAFARAVVAAGSPGLAAVVEAFGASVLTKDGELDRPAMRRRVFADPAARKQLEDIIHPRVRAALTQACQDAPGVYAVASIPLLAEGGGRQIYPWLARILVVDTSDHIQLARLLQRDGIDSTLANTMMASQASRAQRLAIADDVLNNDGSLDALETHVRQLDTLYRRLATAQAS